MTTIALIAAAFLAAPAPQTDRWVDPVHGSDQATGTSPENALKTLTRAFAVTAPGTTIKVMPGVIDAANGESFPMTVPGWIEIESTGGREVTHIDGGPFPALTLNRATRVQGFTLRSNSTYAVSTYEWWDGGNPPNTRLYDCHVIAYNGWGVTARGMELRGCHIEADRVALLTERWDLIASDCVFEAGPGNYCAARLGMRRTDPFVLDFERCTFIAPGGCGAALTQDYGGMPIHTRFANCEFRDCGDDGLWITSRDDRDFFVSVEGCTIANCGGWGIGGVVYDNGSINVDLRSSIVVGNALNDVNYVTSATDSLIGDGSATGPGCLTGDPRFVDEANGDYRLRFDSPCKDVGVAYGEGLDVTGRARSVDGNLDLVGAPDMGAREHVTLTAPESVVLGAPFDVGMTGPVNGFSFLVMDPNGLASSPLTTPYGRLRVYGPTAMRFPPIATTGGGPDTFTVPAFTDPAMVGSSAGLQALTRSTLAPAQAAFSNSASVRVD